MRQNMRLRCWDKEKKVMLPSFPLYKACFAHYDRTGDMIIMLGTGLKDRMGKEIYEGDVLEGNNGIKAIIEWTQEFGRWSMRWSDKSTTPISWHVKHAIVIGNIHENPELLIGG